MRCLQRLTEENLPTVAKQTRRKVPVSPIANTNRPDISYATTLKSQNTQFGTANQQTQQEATHHQQLQLP
jgi:hypothetical protein